MKPVKIERGFEIPQSKVAEFLKALKKLEVGESFVIDVEDLVLVRNEIQYTLRDSGKKFTMRKIDRLGARRVWRIK